MTNTHPLVDLLGITIVIALIAAFYYADKQDKADAEERKREDKP